MLFYGVLLISIILAWFLLYRLEYKSRRKIYNFLVFFVLFALLAFRGPMIGNDTDTYIYIFDAIHQSSSLFENAMRYELGFVILNGLVGLFSSNAQALFIVSAAFVILTFRKLLVDNSTKIWLSVFLFVSLKIYTSYMTLLRQSVAIAFICLAYDFIKKRKPVLFVIMVLLASSFHLSALVFLIAYPLSYIRFKPVFFGSAIAVTGLIFVFFNQFISVLFSILPVYYSSYMNSRYFVSFTLANTLNALVILVFFLMCVLIFFFAKKKDDLSPAIQQSSSTGKKKAPFYEEDLLLYFLLVSFCIAVIAIRASTLDRIYLYFWVFLVIAVPNMLDKIEDKRLSTALQMFILSSSFAYFMITVYIRPEWNHIFPYRFFWQS